MINDSQTITEIIPSRLYLTSLHGICRVATNADIIVSVLHFNPELNNKFPNTLCIYWESQDDDNDAIEIYFDLFKQLMDDNPNKTVYVHCLYGASRSATIIASYLVHYFQNNRICNIIDFLKSKRQCVSPNDGFVKKLKIYRKKNTNDKKR